jgi:hemerythrin
MAYIWREDWATGNKLIDSEHKELFTAINNLLAACSSGKGRAELESTISFLEDYTAKHFGDEEQLQLSSGYPDYRRHKTLHEGFKTFVRQLGIDLKREGPTITLVSKVNAGCGDWLIRHIQTEDKKLAMHLKSTDNR